MILSPEGNEGGGHDTLRKIDVYAYISDEDKKEKKNERVYVCMRASSGGKTLKQQKVLLNRGLGFLKKEQDCAYSGDVL